MKTAMIIGLEGSRRRLEQVLERLLKIEGVKVVYVSWPANNEHKSEEK
jgi:hypothetical protein